ncbi:MAG: SPOR domain-containing protein [Bacteroidales bacterium]|nr:SPOR domain-containing protein [Bacteroidales bacterium]
MKFNPDHYYLSKMTYAAAIFFALLSVKAIAQKEDKIKVILEPSDIKKIEKADKLIGEANNLVEKANQLYLETFQVQGDYELDEKVKRKKVKQLEEQARQKISEASVLYQKGNEIKYGLYKTCIEKFWSGDKVNESDYNNAKLIEEQSNDFYYQAFTLRAEANKMPDGDEKIKKLTQANESEKEAIDYQLTALGLYSGIDLAETGTEKTSPAETRTEPELTKESETAIPAEQYEQPITQQPVTIQPSEQFQPSVTKLPDTTEPGQIVINQQMIDIYNRYMASQGRAGDTLPTSGFKNVSSFDIDLILKLWYAYLNGQVIEVTQEQPSAVVAEITPVSTQPDQVMPEVLREEQVIQEEQIAVVESERQAQEISADDNIVYRVQIAANRTALSQGALQRIYYGNKAVEMIEENGWYKYSVGDFASYADANKFRKSCDVKNAFIAAYRKDKQFLPGIPEKAEGTTLSLSATGDKNMPSGLVFRIQIAASRAPLSKEQIAIIYPGYYPVEMVEEDDWFKYQLMGVRLYSDALNIIKDIPIKGVFIVAYENGIKTNLYRGVVKIRNLERMVKTSGRKNLHETEYHVQLAASKFPIREEYLKQIYNGTEPVATVIEENWYKYHIKAGNSYDQAKQIKDECGVDKAFIVPYKRARKVMLYETIHNTNP